MAVTRLPMFGRCRDIGASGEMSEAESGAGGCSAVVCQPRSGRAVARPRFQLAFKQTVAHRIPAAANDRDRRLRSLLKGPQTAAAGKVSVEPSARTAQFVALTSIVPPNGTHVRPSNRCRINCLMGR